MDKFKLLNKKENSENLHTYIFEVLPPLEEIPCKNCSDKKLLVKSYYWRKTPIFFFKKDILNRIFFKTPVLYCQGCNHIKTYNAGFFEKYNVEIENFQKIFNRL